MRYGGMSKSGAVHVQGAQRAARPRLGQGMGLFVKKSGQKISENFVCDLVKEKARTGIMQERHKWESFQANFTIPMHSVTLTTSQACVITTRVGQTQTPSKDFPASVVVWNGNGIRARWLAARKELKSLVHRLKPDLLCFLEAKVNSEKLLALQDFEEWANEEGFVKMFCHWSTHNSKIAYVHRRNFNLDQNPLRGHIRHTRPRTRRPGKSRDIRIPQIFHPYLIQPTRRG